MAKRRLRWITDPIIQSINHTSKQKANRRSCPNSGQSQKGLNESNKSTDVRKQAGRACVAARRNTLYLWSYTFEQWKNSSDVRKGNGRWNFFIVRECINRFWTASRKLSEVCLNYRVLWIRSTIARDNNLGDTLHSD